MANFESIAKEFANSYKESDVTLFSSSLVLPDKNEVISVIKEIKHLFFPAYFDVANKSYEAEEFCEKYLSSIYFKLKKQIELALTFKTKSKVSDKAKEITDKFVEDLPNVHKMLIKDVHANFEGDPAAQSKEEIIFSYPGFFAIFVYRIANVLYKMGVPFVPRIMTEYAHGKTGIDINPGATIGEYFFIDHGTGIVIGETTVIGNHVKIYQGVTLGALSPRKGQSLAGVKRHPTVCDNVTIYSGASILGGETVIGEGAIIGGNSFITESVEAGAKVSVKKPELIIK